MSRFWWRRIAYILTIAHLIISAFIVIGLHRGDLVPPGTQKALAYGNIGAQMFFLAILVLSRKSK